jgi:hypothetical protein
VRVTLQTRTTTAPLSVSVSANDVFTEDEHFVKAIATLVTARAWLRKQKEQPK